jgi:hypothetical protein
MKIGNNVQNEFGCSATITFFGCMKEEAASLREQDCMIESPVFRIAIQNTYSISSATCVIRGTMKI